MATVGVKGLTPVIAVTSDLGHCYGLQYEEVLTVGCKKEVIQDSSADVQISVRRSAMDRLSVLLSDYTARRQLRSSDCCPSQRTTRCSIVVPSA